MKNAFKFLLITTAVLGLFSPLLFPYLALTFAGIEKGWVWQFATYLFVEPTASNNFGSLLHLAFNLFLLYTFGGALLQRDRPIYFYILYFSAGILAALIGWSLMAFSHTYTFLAGNSSALYAILIAWTLLNPQAKLLLFFSLPFKASWLLLGLIGANLLIDLTNGNWISFCSYGGACIYAYLFSLIAWRAESWIPFLQPFERFIFRWIEKARHVFGKGRSFRHSKIYDFKSGEPVLDDDQFMDAMLARISRYGEDCLTAAEKTRMEKISKKKSSKGI